MTSDQGDGTQRDPNSEASSSPGHASGDGAAQANQAGASAPSAEAAVTSAPAASAPAKDATTGGEATRSAAEQPAPFPVLPSSMMMPRPAPKASSTSPWIFLAVGLGGTLLVILAGRLAVSVDDSQQRFPPPEAHAIEHTPRQPPPPPDLPAPLFTVSASPIGNLANLPDGGFDWQKLRGADATRPGKPGVKIKGAYASEQAALDDAQAALDAKNGKKALAALAKYDEQFGGGLGNPDARVMRIEATALVGDDTDAMRLANEFLEDYPHSPKVDRVRAIRAKLHPTSAADAGH